MASDPSNGYDEVADIFIGRRGMWPAVGEAIGATIVRTWAESFPPHSTVLDLGSGPGEPSTRILRDAGLATYAIDASPKMVAVFRERFPGILIECGTFEASDFFGRQFDGVIAWGLLFLLEPAMQAQVIGKVGRALKPKERFLFTAHREPLAWLDAMTGRPSQSLALHSIEVTISYQYVIGRRTPKPSVRHLTLRAA